MDTSNIPTGGGARAALLRRASLLALITIFYNMGEGLVSVFFGAEDETLALLGFGLDSFVEVISGVGIWHMVMRIQRSGGEDPDRFERRALRITGGAFYLLAVGMVVTAGINLAVGHAPVTTVWGIGVGLVSIVTMWALIRMKVAVGRSLGSRAILADAACTRACLYLSVVLLVSSLGYELFGIGGLDALGALGIAVFAWREGRESFEKAVSPGGTCGCAADCGGFR
jgi:divalent metal cation (Fe/Co/Zn/Cd) transporter